MFSDGYSYISQFSHECNKMGFWIFGVAKIDGESVQEIIPWQGYGLCEVLCLPASALKQIKLITSAV